MKPRACRTIEGEEGRRMGEEEMAWYGRQGTRKIVEPIQEDASRF